MTHCTVQYLTLLVHLEPFSLLGIKDPRRWTLTFLIIYLLHTDATFEPGTTKKKPGTTKRKKKKKKRFEWIHRRRQCVLKAAWHRAAWSQLPQKPAGRPNWRDLLSHQACIIFTPTGAHTHTHVIHTHTHTHVIHTPTSSSSYKAMNTWKPAGAGCAEIYETSLKSRCGCCSFFFFFVNG